MTPAENLYRVLLRLYPEEHRRAYGELMLQHAGNPDAAVELPLQEGRNVASVEGARLTGLYDPDASRAAGPMKLSAR